MYLLQKSKEKRIEANSYQKASENMRLIGVNYIEEAGINDAQSRQSDDIRCLYQNNITLQYPQISFHPCTSWLLDF